MNLSFTPTTAADLEDLYRIQLDPEARHAAWDNLGSQKVLERCGFVRVGTDRGFAPYRDAEIEEVIYRLD